MLGPLWLHTAPWSRSASCLVQLLRHLFLLFLGFVEANSDTSLVPISLQLRLFLGIYLQHQSDGLFLTLHQCALHIIEHTGVVDCKPLSNSGQDS
jgi:hypothetical protein